MNGPVLGKSSKGGNIKQSVKGPKKQLWQKNILGYQSGILTLQRAVGNQAVGGLLRARPDDSEFAENELPSFIQPILRSDSGKTLDTRTRTFMESRFNHDFGQVRIHTDDTASRVAEWMNADAFTLGNSIWFGREKYNRNTSQGRYLLAHELAHTIQQRGPVHSMQSRITIGASNDPAELSAEHAASAVTQNKATPNLGNISPLIRIRPRRVGIIESIARFFGGGTFTDEELQSYLLRIERTQQIEDSYDSDNKAREIVRRWKNGQSGYTVLTVPIRVLLIKEMSSGFLSADDQNAILDLLSESIPSELNYILPRIEIESLKTRFDDNRRRRLDALLTDQEIDTLGMGAEWTLEGVIRILNRHGDRHIIETILNEGYKVFRFETAFDKWRYDDGRIVEEEIPGLRGNTLRDRKEIRVRKSLTDEQAATTVFHEVSHVTSNVTDYLEQEIQVRVETEEFLIRHGLPSINPRYRTREGGIDEQFIRQEIMSSQHYNPSGRTRIGRRYVGEQEVEGWHLP